MNNPEVTLKVLLNFIPQGTEVDAYLEILKRRLQADLQSDKVLYGTHIGESILSRTGQPLSDIRQHALAEAFQNPSVLPEKGGLSWGTKFQLDPNVISQYGTELQKVAEKSNGVATSFWGMWQASWAVRGIMTDLFGYANSGMLKIRQASQAIISGLYVTEAAIKMLTNAYQKHFATTIKGKELEAALNKANLALETTLANKQSTEADISAAKAAATAAEIAQSNAMKAAASPAMGIGIGIGAAVALIGLYQQFLAIAQEVNKSRESIHNLAQSLNTLTTAAGGTKLAFTSLDDLIKEVAKDVPSLATSLLSIQDPIERFAKATAIIYQEDTSKRLPTANPFVRLSEYIKQARTFQHEYNQWARENGATPMINGMQVAPTDPRYYIDVQKQALQQVLAGTEITGEYIDKEQFLNNIFAMRNSLIKDESKNYDKLREEVSKYGVQLIVSQYIEQSGNSIATKNKQKIEELAQAYHNLTEEQIKNDRGRLASALLQQLTALGITNTEDLLTGVTKGLQNYYDIINKYEESNAAKTTPMTLLEFDKQMYENYTAAAKNNSIYSQQADYWKNKLIADLRNEISTQEAAVKGMAAYTDKWKETQVIIAKAKNELEALLHLQEKLSSTWFNIPSATVRPTESQLTQATVYLKPNVYVTASGKNEIAEAVAKGLNEIDYVNNYSTIRGGAGG